MNPFYRYLEKLLAEHLKKHRVAVWYDPREEFVPFVKALPGHGDKENGVFKVTISDMEVSFAHFNGSFFGMKSAVEPFVDKDQPEPLLLYLPGVSRDKKGSVLMELEKGGECFEWQLKRLARFCLLEKYSDGVIDGLLAPENIIYQDIVQFVSQEGAEEPSILKVLFPGAGDNAALVAQWLSDASMDEKILDKGAESELLVLVSSRLGLELNPGAPLEKEREKVVHYVLVNEFRDDLSCDPPSSVAMIPEPENKEQLQLVRKVAEAMRNNHPEEYVRIADQIEKDFGLATQDIDPSALGKVDTFAFEEKALLEWTAELILKGEYKKALSLVSERRRSFWADRTLERQSQWTACRLIAHLGEHVSEARRTLTRAGKTPAEWVEAYTKEGGWNRVDLAQQQAEAWVAKMIVDPKAESALEKVRQAYEDLLQDMAVGYVEVLNQSGWSVPEVLPQVDVYPKVVDAEKTTVAYFLVDAMRFSMAHELVEMIGNARDVVINPAVAAWPTITLVGMAALLPGASAGFKVVESAGKLAAEIDGIPLSDSNARLKFMKARVPGMVDIQLEKLLQMSTKKVQGMVSGVSLFLVRSQEIDTLGEISGGLIARQVMDTMVGNVARAVRKLADCGITRFVIASDHGHLFTRKKEDAFKTDPPGGKTVEIHRRCWVGQGGMTPTGTVRLAAAEMGYTSDLEFVFPKGIGVFRTGGDLGYHHGGLSLQEMIIPVVSFRMGQERPARGVEEIILSGVPEKLTNRTFGIQLEMGGLFSKKPYTVRPLLLSKGVIVGKAGMALDGDYDQDSACVTIQPSKKASVAMLLENEDCEKVKVVIQDPSTDRVLVEHKEIPVELGTK